MILERLPLKESRRAALKKSLVKFAMLVRLKAWGGLVASSFARATVVRKTFTATVYVWNQTKALTKPKRAQD